MVKKSSLLGQFTRSNLVYALIATSFAQSSPNLFRMFVLLISPLSVMITQLASGLSENNILTLSPQTTTNVPYAIGFDLDATQSYSAFQPDPSCLILRHFQQFLVTLKHFEYWYRRAY